MEETKFKRGDRVYNEFRDCTGTIIKVDVENKTAIVYYDSDICDEDEWCDIRICDDSEYTVMDGCGWISESVGEFINTLGFKTADKKYAVHKLIDILWTM